MTPNLNPNPNSNPNPHPNANSTPPLTPTLTVTLIPTLSLTLSLTRWPSWLPRLHLEIIRRPVVAQTPANVEAELAQLRDVFPQMTELALRRALLQSSSLETAIESLLEASLDT